MQLTTLQTLTIMICVCIGTFATRGLAFLLFPENKKRPELIEYLSQTIPAAMMGLLVIYCLKNVSITTWPHGLPELIAIAITALLHLWRKNVLLSILVGTAAYMLMGTFLFT